MANIPTLRKIGYTIDRLSLLIRPDDRGHPLRGFYGTLAFETLKRLPTIDAVVVRTEFPQYYKATRHEHLRLVSETAKNVRAWPHDRL